MTSCSDAKASSVLIGLVAHVVTGQGVNGFVVLLFVLCQLADKQTSPDVSRSDALHIRLLRQFPKDLWVSGQE